MSGMNFDDIRPDLMGCLYLVWFRIDKKTYLYAFFLQLFNRFLIQLGI
jgi:hypothetical protein